MFLKADKIVYLLGIISCGGFAALVSIYSTRTEFVGSAQNKTHVHCNEGTRHPVQQHGSLKTLGQQWRSALQRNTEVLAIPQDLLTIRTILNTNLEIERFSHVAL